MTQTIRVEGLKELNRLLARTDKEAQRELQKALRKVAEPVAVSARMKATQFGPRTSRMIRAGSSRGQAVVREGAGRKTGKRPDFGRLLMRKVLLSALYEHEDEIRDGVERMLDDLADRFNRKAI